MNMFAPIVGAPRTTVIAVDDPTGAGEARRAVNRITEDLGFCPECAGRAALVATELAGNLAKHAKDGEVLLRSVDGEIEIMTVDRGPGMDVAASLRDGHSSAGTRGVGLGAVHRNSDGFDGASWPDVGTVLVARIRDKHKEPSCSPPSGIVQLPYPGEEACGDLVGVVESGRKTLLYVADGLGHGLLAAEAVHPLRALFARESHRELSVLLDLAHEALSGSRGAALALARIDSEQGTLAFAGVGNVACDILTDEGRVQSCVSQHGIVGVQMRRVSELLYPAPAGSLVVLASDGLSQRWRLDRTPGIAARDPALLAGMLYRHHRRERDDVTVLAHRVAGP